MYYILVVDDSPVVRNYHMNILKSVGFNVAGAGDGIEALEKALANTYHLILCDINMPNMDGLTFIRKYRELEKETPIIIITTQEEVENKLMGYKSGANLYITKPVQPQFLITHVQMLIGTMGSEELP